MEPRVCERVIASAVVLGAEVAEGVLDLLDGSHPKFRAPFEPPAIRQRLRPNL